MLYRIIDISTDTQPNHLMPFVPLYDAPKKNKLVETHTSRQHIMLPLHADCPPPRADCPPPRADCPPPRADCPPPRADCPPPAQDDDGAPTIPPPAQDDDGAPTIPPPQDGGTSTESPPLFIILH